ncbi:hypothetical protein ACFVW1_20675 [Streptomyces olivochromogenes]|uniref:hypothetical protein n=1 Tax=Streptomyces olivochromogenes TaxID=1963 RepID=UPI0036DC59AA
MATTAASYYVENGEEVHPHPECTAHPAGAQELLGVADPAALTPPVPMGDPEADAAAMVTATSSEFLVYEAGFHPSRP